MKSSQEELVRGYVDGYADRGVIYEGKAYVSGDPITCTKNFRLRLRARNMWSEEKPTPKLKRAPKKPKAELNA